jgi:heme O synthase-like polyprenyltransferase
VVEALRGSLVLKMVLHPNVEIPSHTNHSAVIVAAMFYATTTIIPNPQLGLKWWYGIIAIINAALLVLAFFFLYETKFDRPSDAERM